MQRNIKICLAVLFLLILALAQEMNAMIYDTSSDEFKIGWASVSITPDQPIFIAGQFHARVSEGVWDPVMATAMAIESGEGERVIMVSLDLVSIADELREAIYAELRNRLPEIAPGNFIVSATHTHSAPFASAVSIEEMYGIDPAILGDNIMLPTEYIDFAVDRIVQAGVEAWNSREQSGISYGLGHAVVGHNRLNVYENGSSQMYGNANRSDFSHVEGYEDHTVNLLYSWDESQQLTGIVVNVAIPSQVTGQSYHISADFWVDVRKMVNEKFGREIPILAQTGAAGDQSPHVQIERSAEERMQRIIGLDSEEGTGRGTRARRQQLGLRIVGAVMSVYPYMSDHIDWNPAFGVEVDTLSLARRMISEEDVEYALELARGHQERYEAAKNEMETNPDLMDDPRWYREVTGMYRRTQRGRITEERFDLQNREPEVPIEIHVVRLGDVVFATNPFELYLDYGTRMKARSAAMQTFIVQLTGSQGRYLPSPRAIPGNAYGAIPASTLVGPEGGKILVESTLKMIENLW